MQEERARYRLPALVSDRRIANNTATLSSTDPRPRARSTLPRTRTVLQIRSRLRFVIGWGLTWTGRPSAVCFTPLATWVLGLTRLWASRVCVQCRAGPLFFVWRRPENADG
jgi:hypothetical protein